MGKKLELLDLPVELLVAIVCHVQFHDIVTLLKTCRHLRQCIRFNETPIYIGLLDTPSEVPQNVVYRYDFVSLMELYAVLHSTSPLKSNRLPFVHYMVKRLLAGAAHADPDETFLARTPSRNVALLSSLFQKSSARDAFLCQSSIFERLRSDKLGKRCTDGKSLRYSPYDISYRGQMSAELHCLAGAVLLHDPRSDSDFQSIYPYAAAKIFDPRAFLYAARAGPFWISDVDHVKRVDWEKIEAMLIILRYNLRRRELLNHPYFDMFRPENFFVGSHPHSYAPLGPTVPSVGTSGPSLNTLDPYGIAGTWMHASCFVTEDVFPLSSISHDTPLEYLHPPIHAHEHLIFSLLQVQPTHIDEAGPDDRPGTKVVHFQGSVSRIVPGVVAMDYVEDFVAQLYGNIRTTADGDVYCSFWLQHSNPPYDRIWEAHTVQIGGPQSARGLVGCFYDPEVELLERVTGIVAIWKMHDGVHLHATSAPLMFCPHVILSEEAKVQAETFSRHVVYWDLAQQFGDDEDKDADKDHDDLAPDDDTRPCAIFELELLT